MSGWVERVVGSERPNIVLIAEHAGSTLPVPWPEEDRWLIGTHWSTDLKIREVVLWLAERWGTSAVMSRFSRLWIDPNRHPTSTTLLRETAESRPIVFNTDLTEAMRQQRMVAYEAYHQAAFEMVSEHQHPLVLSLHSFTKHYDGKERDLEIGVLFDKEEQLAKIAFKHLKSRGWNVALNKPYSGIGGLMYSASHHAASCGGKALELELRQDLLADPDVFERLLTDVYEAIEQVRGSL